MWKIRFSMILVAAAFLGLLAACTEDKPKAINFGEYKDGSYTNSYFNLQVPIPDEWYVMDDESRIELMRRGAQVMAGNNENLSAVVEATDLKNISLLVAAEKPIGAPTPSNPAIMVIAEDVRAVPGIQRGSDYHYHSKMLMEQSAVTVTFPRPVYEEKVDQVSFDVLEGVIDFGGRTQFQKQYVTIYNGYALLISLSYQDEAGLDKLRSVLQQVSIH